MSALLAYLFGQRGQQKAIAGEGEKDPKVRYEENIVELKRKIILERQRRDSRLAAARIRVQHQDNEIRDKILALPMTKLRDSLQKGDYTALTVLKAYSWKALCVNDELNCLCDFLMEAFDEAAELDRCYPPTSTKKPPLFGLPFSVKLGNEIPGCEWNVGVATYIGDPPARNESTFVAQLRSLGAVPFVIANASHFVMLHFTLNPVYGWTGNPLDPTKNCGGSSGGDAALKGAGGSAFGIGNDMGGSLRIPSTMCGLTTLKPTKGRYDLHYAHTGVNGCRAVFGATGFIVRDVQDLIELWRAVLPQQGDCERVLSSIAPLSLDLGRIEAIASGQRKLRIGYYTDDGHHPTTPAFRRGVTEVVEKLRTAGHTLVPFQLPGDLKRVSYLKLRLLMVNGYVQEAFRWGEPYVWSDSIPPGAGPNPNPAFTPKYPPPSGNKAEQQQHQGSSLWEWTQWMMGRSLMNWASQRSNISAFPNGGTPAGPTKNKKDEVGPQMDSCGGSTSIEEYRQYQCEMDDYIVEFYKYWKSMRVDAVIAPGWYHCAAEHRFTEACIKEYPAFMTGIYNVLNYPVGISPPVSFVTDEDCAELQDERRWPTAGNSYLTTFREAAKSGQGLPIAVQVIGAPYEEEVVLGVMRLIEKLTEGTRRIGSKLVPPAPATTPPQAAEVEAKKELEKAKR